MKKLFDTLEVAACLVLLLLSECWQIVRKAARPVGVALERLALVALYILGEVINTVSGLFADDSEGGRETCCGC